MPKSSSYKLDSNISNKDILFGSDGDNQLKSKNFSIEALKSFLLSDFQSSNQDNIFRSVSFVSPNTDTEGSFAIKPNDELASLINSSESFTVGSTDIFLFKLRLQGVFYVFTFKDLGKGIYGLGETQISGDDLQVISEKDLSFDNIQQDSTTDTINLFNIGSNSVSDAVNALNPAIEIKPVSEGFTLFRATQDGEEKSWFYQGDSGTFGLNESQTVTSDFDEIKLKGDANVIKVVFLPTKLESESSPNYSNVREYVVYEIPRLDTFTIDKNDIVYYRVIYDNIYYTLVLAGESSGTYGVDGDNFIRADQVAIISEKTLNIGAVVDSTTDEIDLGDIGGSNIEDAVNASTFQVQPTTQGLTIFKATQSSTEKAWLYLGDSGTVGIGGYQTTSNDFDPLSLETQQGYTSADFDADFDSKTTDELTEGSSNLYNVQADLSQTDNTAPDFIKNRRKEGKLVTSSTYTLLLSDENRRLDVNAPCTVIVPNGLPADVEFIGKQVGSGDVEFVAESGGTLNVNAAFQKFTEGEHAYWGIVTLGSDEADLLGTLKLSV